MSNPVSTWVWDNSKASGNDLIILLKIADNANDDGGGAYPGIAHLAQKARISKRAVYDCLRRLKASGELAEEAGGGGRGRKTTYRVLMTPKGEEAAPNPRTGNGAAPRSETVQPAALNGADPGIPYKEEPPRNLPENQDPPTPQPTLTLVAQARPVDQPLELFKLWQTDTGHEKALFSPKRREVAWKAILAYGFDYCALAVTGWRNSPHHRGENRNGTVYNSFDLIFRDPPHIEQFHGFADGSAVARPTRNGKLDWQAIGASWSAQLAIEGGER